MRFVIILLGWLLAFLLDTYEVVDSAAIFWFIGAVTIQLGDLTE